MHINLDGIQWHYTSTDAAEGLKKIGKTPRVSVVKATAHHGVYRHEDGFYIKIFQYPFYRSFRPRHSAKACKDGRNALFLQQIGISTPKVLAFGEERRGLQLKRDVLITFESIDLQPLPEFIRNKAPGLSCRHKRVLITEFSDLIKKLHQSGVYHRDLNPGNLFIEQHPDGYRFVLLDLDKMRLYPKPISTAKRIRNLGDLLQMLWLLTSVSQRFFFLKAYGWADKREKHVLDQIEACVHKSNFKRGKVRYRKSLSSRGGVICEHRDQTVVYRLAQSQVRNAMEALLPQLETMKESRLSVSGKKKISTINIFLDANHYTLTRFHSWRRFYSRFSSFWKTPAVKTWRIAWGGFLVRKIPILKPIMLIQTKPDSTSFILYESSEHIVALSRFWKDLDLPGKEALIIRLGMFIGYMHRTGCIHGNLSWENILIDTGGKEPQVVFHHVENAEIHRRTPPKAALKDLSVFALRMKEVDPSPAAWNLFMRCYEKRSGQVLSPDNPHILFPPQGPIHIPD